MTHTEEKRLDNNYVEKYYNAQVGALSITYEKDRWHSSPVKEFEYQQTKRALEAALGARLYRQGVEIGPGDGVWTKVIKERVTGDLQLVEQSEAMLAQAQRKLSSMLGLTFEHGDFMTSHPKGNNDLIVAMRCFEYFDNKKAALKKMKDLVVEDGKIIIITKNKDLITSSPVQDQRLHSDQVSRSQMLRLAEESGLYLEKIYPAVLRWKAWWYPMRILFNLLHKVYIWTGGLIFVPFVTNMATESYVYILRKES